MHKFSLLVIIYTKQWSEYCFCVTELLDLIFISNFTLWCYQDLLKGIFFEVKKKFETALGVLKKEKITIDPDDPAAVSCYAQVMKTVREK
jgi:hypothetical protein